MLRQKGFTLNELLVIENAQIGVTQACLRAYFLRSTD